MYDSSNFLLDPSSFKLLTSITMFISSVPIILYMFWMSPKTKSSGSPKIGEKNFQKGRWNKLKKNFMKRA